MKYRNLFIGKTGFAAIILVAGGIVAGCFVPTNDDRVEDLIYSDIHNNVQKLRATQDLTQMRAFYSKYPRALDKYIDEHVADSTMYAGDLRASIRAAVKGNPNMGPKQILNKMNNAAYSNAAINNLRRDRDIVRDISVSLDMARRVQTEIQR